VGSFTKISALLESLHKALKELTKAVYAAKEAQSKRGDINNKIFAEVTFTEEAERQRHSEQQKHYGVQRMLAITGFLAFITAAFYASITVRQLHELRRQSAEQQRQARIENRAWVKIDVDLPKDGVQFVEGQDVSVGVQLQNVGKTAARTLSVKTRLEVLPNTQAANVEYDFAKWSSHTWFGETSGILFPEDKPRTDYPIFWFADVPGLVKREPNSAEVIEWHHGDLWIAVYGEVDYSDIFGVPHWTRFCRTAIGTDKTIPGYTVTNSRTCSDYNDADRNADAPEPPKSAWERFLDVIA
jgi:hypothetical protein